MSQRYIIRNEKSSTTTLSFDESMDFVKDMMTELFDYRDEIGYNSWIYVITTTFTNSYKPTYNPNSKKMNPNYEIVNQIARRYIDATNGNSNSNYTTSNETIEIPRTIILINENLTARCVEVNTKLLKQIWELSQKATSHWYNLGHLLFEIDSSYNPERNTILGNDSCKVPIDLLPFISKNIPDITNYNKYTNKPPNYLIKFIDQHLEEIKADLLIIEPVEETHEIKYIKLKSIQDEVKLKRIAQLEEELRKLKASQ